MTTPFKFPLQEQKELFPDLKHDSTYGYEDESSDWGQNSRLMKTEYVKYFEYVDSEGIRRVKKVTEEKTFFDTDSQRKNPACSTSVEIL